MNYYHKLKVFKKFLSMYNLILIFNLCLTLYNIKYKVIKIQLDLLYIIILVYTSIVCIYTLIV